MNSSRPKLAVFLVLGIGLLAAWFAISRRASGSLVVYCTHDLVYAEPVLEEFTRNTGIKVTLVGDTEATKSLGLIERLLREGNQTPCDLFWNNEVLGTIRLQQKGLLAPYIGTGAERIPPQFRDAGQEWFGFGGRMRVWTFQEGLEGREGISAKGQVTRGEAGKLETRNPKLETGGAAVRAEDGEHPSSFEFRTSDFEFPPPSQPSPPTLPLSAPDLSRVAIAKPLYGTTFTQFAMLWKLRGPGQTQLEHLELVERGCKFVAGNAMVRDVVAGGSCDLGMTDTDDVFAARDSGYKVEMVPIRIDGRTLCIPNTVSILKSSDRPAEARQLLEYLLSEEVELKLAQTARQIPLGVLSEEKIPAEIRPLAQWAKESWNVAEAAEVAPACLEWLKSEYAR